MGWQRASLPVWKEGRGVGGGESSYLGNSLKSFGLCLERKKYNFPAHCKSFVPILLSYFALAEQYIAHCIWLYGFGRLSTKATQLILHILQMEHTHFSTLATTMTTATARREGADGLNSDATSSRSSRGYYIKIT